jgi:hypothetical protein
VFIVLSKHHVHLLERNIRTFAAAFAMLEGINMRKTLLALAGAATLGASSASPAYAGPPTYPGPRGYPYWSGYVDAPVGEPTSPCYWRTQRLWDGSAWRVRRVRICG